MTPSKTGRENHVTMKKPGKTVFYAQIRKPEVNND